jgi:hypothetical protein
MVPQRHRDAEAAPRLTESISYTAFSKTNEVFTLR